MNTLLRYLFQWLGSKLMTLLGIVAILLVAYWFRTEWGEISKLLKTASAVENKIAEKKTSIQKLRSEAERLGDAAQKAMKELENLDNVANKAQEEAKKAKADYDYWKSLIGWWEYFDKTKLKNAADAWAIYVPKNGIAITAQAAADLARKAQENSPWALKQAKIDMEQKDMESLQAEKEVLATTTAKTPVQRLILSVYEVLPTALWILVGCILTPPAIKALLYFGIAPQADKVAPIIIMPGGNTQLAPQMLSSGVSLDVAVSVGDELLVHPDYLQSTAKSARKQTKWFLNHHLPFSSIASGMCLLTRIRAQDGENESAKISATRDPLGEVALIELPAGAAMVLYPRSLVAVMKPQNQDIPITRIWRLKNLHSWLTLQFRYLVFHGPCNIVVKGCRGVCVEKPAPEKPRLINQAATIGFSANLDYSNTRSEVFLSYLRGKDDLFNDLFGGEKGVFIYEEMPDLRRKAGLTGRGIEGITDALLKAFGV